MGGRRAVPSPEGIKLSCSGHTSQHPQWRQRIQDLNLMFTGSHGDTWLPPSLLHLLEQGLAWAWMTQKRWTGWCLLLVHLLRGLAGGSRTGRTSDSSSRKPNRRTHRQPTREQVGESGNLLAARITTSKCIKPFFCSFL